MAEETRHTERIIPVVIGNDYAHVMAKAVVVRTPTSVTIEITSLPGHDSQRLAEFLEQAEPIAVSFTAVPVRNIREKRE